MENDRRESPRFEAKGLAAKISTNEPNGSIFIVDVNILDVSRTGIKLRSQKPLTSSEGAKVQVEVILPESGLPVILDAVVVHNKFNPEFGLHYIDIRPEDPLEQLITECSNRTSWVDN